jgi:hypothetical protein
MLFGILRLHLQNVFYAIVAEVNAKLPPNERISTSGWSYPGYFSRISTLHRRFYPDSDLRRRERRLMVVFYAHLPLVGLLLYVSMRSFGVHR